RLFEQPVQRDTFDIKRMWLFRGEGDQYQAAGQQRQRREDQPTFTISAAPGTDEAHLNDDQNHPDDEKNQGVALTKQSQPAEGEQPQQTLEAEEDQLLDKHQQQQHVNAGAA